MYACVHVFCGARGAGGAEGMAIEPRVLCCAVLCRAVLPAIHTGCAALSPPPPAPAASILDSLMRSRLLLPADGPTYATPTSFDDALKAACTATALVDALVASSSSSSSAGGSNSAGGSSSAGGGEGAPRLAASAFSICRPPGHHATAGEQMGFCLLNNAALAARHAQRAHGLRRVGGQCLGRSCLKACTPGGVEGRLNAPTPCAALATLVQRGLNSNLHGLAAGPQSGLGRAPWEWHAGGEGRSGPAGCWTSTRSTGCSWVACGAARAAQAQKQLHCCRVCSCGWAASAAAMF